MVQGKKINETTDSSGKISVSVWTATTHDVANHHDDFEVKVEEEWVCIGGGATGHFDFPENPADDMLGHFLTASFPMGDWKTWRVSSRGHISPDPIALIGFAIGMKIEGLSPQELVRNLRHTSTISPFANHPDHSCFVEPTFLLLGGGFQVLDQPEGGGNMATGSFPDSTISWRARSKDEKNLSESRIRVFAIGISPVLRKSNGLVVGNVVTTFASSEDMVVSDFAESSAKPLEGFALCGGGADAHYSINDLLWSLEPTKELNPDPTPQDPNPKLDPSKQSFTGRATTHLFRDPSTLTAYAMGIKFEPSPPPPLPITHTCDKKVIIFSTDSSGNEPTFTPNKVRDNDLCTKWMSQNMQNPFIELSLSIVRPVCRVDIAWADGNIRTYKFLIEVSMDHTNYTNVFPSGISTGTTQSFEIYTFDPTEAKWIRITITDSGLGSGNSIAQISEIAVYSNV